MNRKTSRHLMRKLTALLLALLMVCGGGALLAAAEGVTTPTDLEEPAPAAPAEPEPTVYRVSIFVQNSASASDFTWVGKLPLTESNGVPALSIEQLTALLSEKGYSLDLTQYAFQYGTGSEMLLANWLGSETRGENPVVVLHRAPAETELFVLLSPLSADGEDEIIIDEGSLDVIGPAKGEDNTTKSVRQQVEVVNLSYAVSVEIVDPKECYCYGDAVTVKAVITGTIGEPAYQWEVLPIDAEEWIKVEGETNETYTFILDETNSNALYGIRVTVFDVASESKGE